MLMTGVQTPEQYGAPPLMDTRSAGSRSDCENSTSSGPDLEAKLEKLATSLILTGLVVALIHLFLGNISAGGRYGDDGSGGLIGLAFLACIFFGFVTGSVAGLIGCWKRRGTPLE
eukprot:gnl/MRDRNA2_/MRDRNA2_32155_c0_seq2.p1 gnl/MRDRNA2_/MRDRNA2_32155_c0~~gnl/MRDRNA2_/MRDRNA2_32155_c0_seq2.p1  ORF type:complete len:115 (+),score=12.11 gnl/MRDRNA2_/MRDRNA2_32155_c0_seq2:90-434(+)